MSFTKLDDSKVFELAKEIAKDAAAREGLREWCVHEVHVRAARQKLATESGATMKKVVTAPTAEDEELLRKAREAQSVHRYGGPTHQRTEFGDVALEGDVARGMGVEGARVQVAHDQGSDEIIVQGHRVGLGSIDINLRDAFLGAATSYINHEEDQAGQVRSRALVSVVVNSILRHHDNINAKVREHIRRQRYD